MAIDEFNGHFMAIDCLDGQEWPLTGHLMAIWPVMVIYKSGEAAEHFTV